MPVYIVTKDAGYPGRSIGWSISKTDSHRYPGDSKQRNTSVVTRLLLGHYLVRFLLHLRSSGSVAAFSKSGNDLLDGIDSASRAAGLGKDDLARLVDDEDAALGALGRFLEPDSGDQSCARVAEQRVGQLLLLLEGGVGLGRVG